MHHLRLVILLLASAYALALVGTRALFVHQDNEAALQRTAAGAEDLARMVEQYARRSFATADLVTTDVAAYVEAHGGVAALRDDADAMQFLRNLARRSHHDYLMLLDAEGVPVAANVAPRLPASRQFDDRDWFRALLAGAETHIGGPLLGRLSDEVMFTFSRAIPRAGGGLDGVVVIGIRPHFFQDTALTADTGRNAVLGLWSAEGQVIARTGLRPENFAHRASFTAQLAEAMRDGSASFRHRSTIDGQDRLVSLRRVGEWPAVAAASLPADAGLAAYASTHGWTAWVTAATVVAVGMLCWVALRLSNRAENAAAAAASARAALEERVAERTRELAEANARLAENEARYRSIFNSTFQFTGLLAPDGTVLEANETALRFGGLNATEVIGKPVWETRWAEVGPEAQAQVREAVARAAVGEFVRYETKARGAGDSSTILDFSLKPVFDADGRATMLVAEGRDISRLKAAQAQLHEAQKLELLGQLTGGVAHDFNNLLMVILGNLALLRKRLPADDARLQRLIDGASQGAERGAALTRRLLAFARRQELRPQAIDLAKLVTGMDELLRRTVGPLCRIGLALPADLPPARADLNQVELALLNLAVNARDAMPEGGDLRIAIRHAMAGEAGTPDELAPGQYLCLTVADSGTGMDAATLARATEPFFTTKGPGKGSGLGLSMVHGLAMQSGGRLRIDSVPGRGTTVELWLPAATAADQALAAPAATQVPQVSGRPLSILLVDDDPLVQAGSVAMLEDLGHRVTLAGSGPAALEILRSPAGFDLLIADYAMPGMDGLELARRATALRPLLPVVLATGYAELSDRVETTLPRLDKPYRQEALAALIGRVVVEPVGSNVVRLPLPPRG